MRLFFSWKSSGFCYERLADKLLYQYLFLNSFSFVNIFIANYINNADVDILLKLRSFYE
ncbi:hypothetical protein XSR1_10209 [Xenorhabdus szentirmaii DSM 16338]|uniref:Uncharacterized protein n=1 Tax=Xenorhabdus szentirmaii DSM 16338 TaxID=1427518 RepID=W1IU45_9GAMM|nr:hypothetical protein XSR1_10209 [Xenorhabdus szentirmaii DSM 16338]